MAILITASILGIAAFSTFYLFFAPAPFIEVIIPPPIKEKSEISDTIKLDISDLQKSTTLNSLRTRVAAPEKGTLGRANPFLTF